MPKQRKDRIGVLVIRAVVEAGRRRRLIVQLLEVNPNSPDHLIGIVDSSAAASRLVGEWLNSLEKTATTDNSAPHQPAEGDR